MERGERLLLEIPERIPVLLAQGCKRSDHADMREPSFIRPRMSILSDRGEMKVLYPFSHRPASTL
jgi:hypothetical protein